MNRPALICSVFLLAFSASLSAQQPSAPPEPAAPQTSPQAASGPAYTPKYSGDPARSDSEFAAIAYVRTVIRAEKAFNKQYGHYALTLSQLVHTGNFTKRMVDPKRGDYTVSYKGKNESYVLTMMPRQIDGTHRSLYADDEAKIHADEEKLADANSPVLR